MATSFYHDAEGHQNQTLWQKKKEKKGEIHSVLAEIPELTKHFQPLLLRCFFFFHTVAVKMIRTDLHFHIYLLYIMTLEFVKASLYCMTGLVIHRKDRFFFTALTTSTQYKYNIFPV